MLLALSGITTSIFLLLLGVAAAAFTNFIAQARRFGGKIKTSEAAILWDHAEKLRKEYREEIEELRERVDALEQRNDKLDQENDALRQKVRTLEDEVERLRDDNERLRKREQTLAQRISELEGNSNA
jgi:peptidoglycan hydrolase CwlO-like protein